MSNGVKQVAKSMSREQSLQAISTLNSTAIATLNSSANSTANGTVGVFKKSCKRAPGLQQNAQKQMALPQSGRARCARAEVHTVTPRLRPVKDCLAHCVLLGAVCQCTPLRAHLCSSPSQSRCSSLRKSCDSNYLDEVPQSTRVAEVRFVRSTTLLHVNASVSQGLDRTPSLSRSSVGLPGPLHVGFVQDLLVSARYQY